MHDPSTDARDLDRQAASAEEAEVGRGRFLRLGAAAAIAAAAPAVAAAVSHGGPQREDFGLFGTVASVVPPDQVLLELRDSGEIVTARLAAEAVEVNGLPSAGQWISVFGARTGNVVADADFTFVSEFLPSVPPGELKSNRFRFGSRTFRMRFRGDAPETLSSEDLPSSPTDVVALRSGDGTYDVIAVGDHPRAP